MTSSEIMQVAELLKPAVRAFSNGQKKLCLSTAYLHKLLGVISAEDPSNYEPNTSSFNILPTSKNRIDREVKFLCEFVQQINNLKIVPDVGQNEFRVDLSRFVNLEVLEVQKVDVNVVEGLQMLRPRLVELVFCHGLDKVEDLLEKCGGDCSQAYIWGELKKACFSHNNLEELGEGFAAQVPWLHTLDLSHNRLKSVDVLNGLVNLKQLNLSFNQLDGVPAFRGPICNRLQVLVIKNNFIEDVSGLTQLVNLVQLDLSQNCLLDHKFLAHISNLASLHSLNLLGNPLSFHPHHRPQTCNYLNKNTSTVRFILDGQILSKSEKSLLGTLHLVVKPSTSLSSSQSSLQDYSPSERVRRVRNVTIEDAEIIVLPTKEAKPPATTPLGSKHLEIKQQVELLRKEHGESWLNKHGGLLGEHATSTPYGSFSSTFFETAVEIEAPPTPAQEAQPSIVESTIFDVPTNKSDGESDGEDLAGDESIFLAVLQPAEEQVLVVVTQSHISERDSTTSKERARWHINMVRSCTKTEDEGVIKLEFDTVRRDRKERLYVFEPDEVKGFYEAVLEGMKREESSKKDKSYSCFRCLEKFEVLRGVEAVECPYCRSSLVVEDC